MSATLKPEKLTGSLAEKAPKIAFVVGAISLVLSLLFYFKDHHTFFHSYLFAFSFFLTLSLGSMFFVLIQRLVRAGWSVTVRRIPEHLMKNIGLMAIFFIPILFGLHELYHWAHLDEVAHDHLLQIKYPYLNLKFFLIRALLFFGVWIWLSKIFFSKSVKQDETGEENLTAEMQKSSTFGILLFAATITFAAVDWLMSLTPHWYSTMWGVYIFAGAAVVSLATINLFYIILIKKGFLKNAVNVEHIHDLGKLLYGFNIFWAYISFSQYFLIWYAGIPEETAWFFLHFNGSWNSVAVLLAIGHFGVPFVLFMSRHAKRNLNVHAAMAIWLIIMHIVELYWLIMPNAFKDGVTLRLVDLTCFLGIGGIYIGVFLNRLKTTSLFPNKDPRLEEALRVDNG